MKFLRPFVLQALLVVSCLSVTVRAQAQLAFSDNGRVLHKIGNDRLITYDVGTGRATKIVKLPPDSQVFSVTSDGRTAVIAEGACPGPIRVMDTENGHGQDIPLSWYNDPGNCDPTTQISGDGRLISIYSETATSRQTTVTVYDWMTKALVVKRTNQLFGAGGSWGGGVTVDGAVEFTNNRAGRKIVDLMTGHLMAQFSPDSVRSSDGAWMIEFPNLWAESLPNDLLIKDGRSGQTRGKFVGVQEEPNEGGGTPQHGGAFCGAMGRFVLWLNGRIAVYGIPAGNLLVSFPAQTWQDPNNKSGDPASAAIACSSNGRRVAVLSGSRLTFHDLK